MNPLNYPPLSSAGSRKPLIALVVACFLAAGASAQTTYTWKSSNGTGTWTTTTDWNPTSPASGPGSLDTVTNGTDTGNNLNLPQGTTSVGTLTAGTKAGNFPIVSASTSTAVTFDVGTINQTTVGGSTLLIRDNASAEDLDLEVGTINVSTGSLDLGNTTAGQALFKLNSTATGGAVNMSGGTLNLNVMNDYNLGLVTATGTGSTIALIDSADPTIASRTATVTGLAGAGALTIEGAVGTPGGSATLNIDGTGSYSSAAVLSDGNAAGKTLALTVNLSGGEQTLTGASTYSGGTTLTSGTLIVNNASGAGLGSGAVTVNGGSLYALGSNLGTGAVTVNSGGRMGGTGNLAPTAGNNVTVGGTLNPGDAVNHTGALTLTLSGGSKLLFNSGSTLSLTLGGASGSGSVAFATTGDWLNGSGSPTLNITTGANFAYGTSYTVLSNVDTSSFTIAGVMFDGTALGSSQYDFGQVGDNYEFTALSAVPEPSTYALLAGAAALGWAICRRWKKCDSAYDPA